MSSDILSDPNWVRQVKALQEHLAILATTTSNIKRATKGVKTADDIPNAKKKIDEYIIKSSKSEVRSIHDTLNFVQCFVSLHNSDPSVKHEASKIAYDAKKQLDLFEITCNAFTKHIVAKRQEYAAKTAAATGIQGTGNRGSASRRDRRSTAAFEMEEVNDEEENTALLTGEAGGAKRYPQQQQITQREQFERDMHEEILKERSTEVQNIMEDVVDINEIFQHINEMVGEQGVKLVVVEENVMQAEVRTSQGTGNLIGAAEISRKSRFRQAMCAFLVFVFLAIVVAVLTAK